MKYLIRVIVIVTKINEGADKIFLLCPTDLGHCELLRQHFPPVLLKLQPYQLGSNIPSSSSPPQEEVAPKFSGLEEHSRTFHHTLHNIYVFTIRK
jgi:hypothetical protein